jgi:hypothetical protein
MVLPADVWYWHQYDVAATLCNHKLIQTSLVPLKALVTACCIGVLVVLCVMLQRNW